MKVLDILCEIDIEQSFDSFHAHAIPGGVDINPGDVLLLRDAPHAIGFGEAYCGTRSATLIRAGWPHRVWTRFASVFALAELYEVGFQPIGTKG